ncbi:MAG TPA: hypothetical protein VN948_09155 [Terriglobales bacterium]|nr:hypothetical protein [Terriglobales bacterium]
MAWLVAIAADAIQIVALPFFGGGGLSPADTLLKQAFNGIYRNVNECRAIYEIASSEANRRERSNTRTGTDQLWATFLPLSM